MIVGRLGMQANAQQSLFYTGVGRAIFSTERLTDGQSALNKSVGSGGYTMVDLGINVQPDSALRANVILRQRNEFGGFYGDGTSLEFRQMQLEGTLAKKFKYELGDIYLKQTPMTIWNEETIDHDYESSLFAMRRDIANYENFMVDNRWRMQGVRLNTKMVNFEKMIQSIGLDVYGGRTRETDFATIPDRYFYGGTIALKQSDLFSIAGHVAGISDIVGTVDSNSVEYDNLVYTTTFELGIDTGEIGYKLNAELGGSNFQLWRKVDDVNNSFSDWFMNVDGKFSYNPLGLKIGVGYRNVGFNFNSPMAQTRRMAAPGDITPQIFPSLSSTVDRSIGLMDQLGQEVGMYNQSISTTLMNYYIKYDMVEPYGAATPNRQGLTTTIDLGTEDDFIQAGVKMNLLSEVVSEGDSVDNAKRGFTLLTGGLQLNIHKLLDFEKQIILHGGVRMESSTREGANPIDLSSTLIDAGIDAEVFSKFHLLGGVKLFTVSGSEFQTGRDELNQIVSFTSSNFDESQSVLAFGFKYDYDKKAYFSVQGTLIDYRDVNDNTIDYDFNQFFCVFGLKF